MVALLKPLNVCKTLSCFQNFRFVETERKHKWKVKADIALYYHIFETVMASEKWRTSNLWIFECLALANPWIKGIAIARDIYNFRYGRLQNFEKMMLQIATCEIFR